MRWLALMRRCAEFKVIAQAYLEDIRKDLNYSSVNVNIFSETRLNCSDKDTDYAIILKLFPVYSKNPFVLGYRVCKNTNGVELDS